MFKVISLLWKSLTEAISFLFFFFSVSHFIPFVCSVSFILVHLTNLRCFSLAVSQAEIFVLFFKNVLRHFHGHAHNFSAFRPSHVSVLVHSTSSPGGMGKKGRKGHVGSMHAEEPKTTTESSFIPRCGGGLGKEEEEQSVSKGYRHGRGGWWAHQGLPCSWRKTQQWHAGWWKMLIGIERIAVPTWRDDHQAWGSHPPLSSYLDDL